MVPHRLNTTGSRTLRLSAVVLAAALIGGCGQQSAGPDTPVTAAEHALTDPSASTTPGSRPSAGGQSSAPETGERPSRTNDTRETDSDSGGGSASGDAPGGTVDGTGGPDAAATATPSREPERSERGTRCHTAMLNGHLVPGHPGAGQRYAELILTNGSDRSCTVYGYPGLQLIGRDGSTLPTDTNRTPDPGPQPVRLAPGESTAATLHWGVVSTGEEPVRQPCRPDPTRLRVIPPDETEVLSINWPFGQVCGGGLIFVSAFH